jgi:hypothetical protein
MRYKRTGSCSVVDCPYPDSARLLCKAHYMRWWLWGDPLLDNPNPPRYPPMPERFWQKVDRSGGPDACWPWTTATNAHGYGVFVFHGSMRLAPRVAWTLTHPEGIPPRMVGGNGVEGKTLLCHNCPGGDNPTCCNPAHHWLGTDWDNTQDKIRKGRQLRGTQIAQSKLTEADVRVVRKLVSSGVVYAAICERFNISPAAVTAIKQRRSWRHIL